MKTLIALAIPTKAGIQPPLLFHTQPRNSFAKLFSRLFALFGVVMMFLSSVAMAADPLEECGYFSGALSTRDACSGSGGVINFTGASVVQNNPDTALATCTVSTPQWVLDQTQTCESADCTAMPGNTNSASVIYNLAPAVAALDASPSNSNTDKTVKADMTLPDYRYDAIDFDYEGEGKTLTFDQPSGFGSNPKTLVVNQITNAWKILFADNENIEIGTITGATYANPFLLKTTATPSTIKIKSLDMKDNSQIDLQASDSIEMETFSVGRGGSDVTLSAPTITINSLTVSNYGSGIATIHLKADTINLGALDMGQGATVIVEPYTAGGKVTYKGNSITASSSSTMRVSSGDYYTDTLNLPGTSNASSIIAMDSSSLVNLYINGNFAPGNNPGINSDGKDGNFGSLPSTTMRIFVNGNFDTGGGSTTVNALMYVEGDVTLGNPSYVRGAISAKHSVTVGEGAHIYYDSNINDEVYAPCPIVATSQDICYDTTTYEGIGHGDFIDTPITDISLSTTYNTSTGTSSSGLKFIQTKIANKTTPLTAVYLNNFGVNIDYSNGGQNSNGALWFAIPMLNDMHATGGCPSANPSLLKNIIDPATNEQAVFTIKDQGTADYSTTKNVIIPSNASKNAKIEMIVVDTSKLNQSAQNCVTTSSTTGNLEGLGQCVNSEVQYVDAFGQTAYDRCAINTTYGQPCNPNNHGRGTGAFANNLGCLMCTFYAGTTCSSDNFAIRPYAFKVFGQNQYKRAGEDFNLTIKALDMAQANITTGLASGVTGVVDYNESLNSLNLTAVALNETNSSISTSCPHAGTFTLANPTDHFTNGEINASTSYSETGIIDIGVSENPGSEFALIDADDTPDIDRYITPSSTVYDLTDINQTTLSAFIPYTIQTDANVSSSGNKDWLYMYSPVTAQDLLNMSAQVNYHITAKNKQGDRTQNFTKTCFFNTSAPTINGMKKNTTFDMFLDFRLQGSNPVDTNLTFYVKDDMTNNAIWMPSLTADLNNTAQSYRQFVFPDNFLNGESNTSVHFNITRHVDKSINPIKVTFLDANTSTSWMANPGATNNFVGTTFANKSKNFLYGRTHAPRYRFTVNPADAKIYYEAYCDASGDKTLLPTGYKGGSDSVGWYLNPLHNASTDGNITVVTEKNGATKVTNTSSLPLTSSNGISTTNLRYWYNGSNIAENIYPYKTTMLVTPSPWLIYDQYDASATNNDFEVEFYGSSNNWTGTRPKDSDGNEINQTTTDSDAATLTNKRILW